MEEKLSIIGKVHKEYDIFKLKDILEKNDAGDWGSEPDENAVRVIRSTNFTNEGRLNLGNVAFRTLKPNKLNDKKLFQGEILIERSGGSDNQPVGRVGLVSAEIVIETSVFANFIQRIAINEDVNSQYLFYCLQQMYEMGITASMQYQTTGIRNLDWKLYTKSILPKPPKTEQIAIATVFSKVDEAIVATENSIKSAEKLKKALMQNLLTGKLKTDGTWRKEEEFYIDEKFGKVPLGWAVKKIKDISEFVQYGLNTSSNEDGNIPMFRMNNIINGKMVSEPMVKISIPDKIFKKYKVLKGDILFNRTNSMDLVGKVGIYELEGDYVFASYLIMIRVNTENDASYVNYCLNYYPIQCNIRSKASLAVSQANINAKSLRNTLLIVPDLDAQRKSAQKISEIESIIQNKQTKIHTLQCLRKSLMQNLLTGKIRLSAEIITQLSD